MKSQMLKEAYKMAAKSPDPSSQNGAIIVNSRNKVIASGYNHFYTGIKPVVHDREEKLRRIEHAERDAIYCAARGSNSTLDGIMACPWAACNECARAIIGARIQTLVLHYDRYLLTPNRWIAEVDSALLMLEEAGVKLSYYTGPVDAAPILISGDLWSPKTLLGV